MGDPAEVRTSDLEGYDQLMTTAHNSRGPRTSSQAVTATVPCPKPFKPKPSKLYRFL